MKIIGLTGGIACGKSTVSQALRTLGAHIIDADALAHALSQPNAPLFNAYVERFGREVVTPDGTLDRAAIARLVFADPAVRAEVDAMAHPLIRAEAERRLRAAEDAHERAAVLDVPLLFEAGWDTLTDEIWVVALPPEKQLARLLRRDTAMSGEEARARMAAQMPLAEKCARADVVIDNSGTEEETCARVEELWKERVVGGGRIQRKLWAFLKFLIVAVTLFAVIGGWAWVERSYIYPYGYRSYIEASAARNHADPYLIAAVIKHESKFQPTARSGGGAVGLMQIMPTTAAWIAGQLGETFAEDYLYDPALNIRYGVWYLAELEREFCGNDILALAAYNAGRGNVHDWMERYHWNDAFDEIEAIPYPETRLYVRRVLEDREQYKRLYDE